MLNTTTHPMKVKKRNGEFEEFNIEKINKVISWAIEGVTGVSLSDIEMNEINYNWLIK